ncbi:MAG TPA: DUF3592 domain-containing protein [Cyclobacteriaceae bacterium]|nr:DUF3592 domain-containing protein [Cyclobacteriaceae bacterium]HRF32891.1 DUF3592 domain-containing protein [Cyclobacteriaceae bacterium]
MVVFIFSLIIGITGLWMGSKLLKNYFYVKGWKQTEATVLSKKVEEQGGYWYVRVEFKYLYNSKEYINHMIYSIELTGGSRQFRYEAWAAKAVGKIENQIKVYVNPEDPAQSFIFRDGLFWPAITLLISIILLLYCLVTFINFL